MDEVSTALQVGTLVGGAAIAAAGVLYAKFLHVGGKVPDLKDDRHGGLLVAQVLKAHGVKYLFTLCGGHISPVLIGCKQAGIRVIDTRHEATAVFAADAVSRLTGIPGVAAVTAGPGVTNAVTAMKNAQMAQSPLILIGGAAATMLKNRGALQDVDQLSIFKSIAKWSTTVTKVSDITGAFRTAFRKALEGVPGPVFVELPIDVLYPIDAVWGEYVGKGAAPKGIVQRAINWYLGRHVQRMFAGAFDALDKEQKPVVVGDLPAPAAVLAKVASGLAKAQRPVLVVRTIIGSQALLDASAAAELQRAVSALGIPTFLSGMARGLLGTDAPNWFRQRRGDALKEADYIILAGVACDFRLSYGRQLSRRATIVSVNRSKTDLKLNADMFWKCSMAVCADPGLFLRSLPEVARAKGVNSAAWAEWTALLRTRQDAKERENEAKATEHIPGFASPIAAAYALERALPKDSVLVADGGDFVATLSYILKPRGPLRWLDPGPFGTLGVGAGFALAAKLCFPTAEVWLIYGDGSCGYSVAEIDTFKRHNLPVIALVGNDACWAQIARDQITRFKDDVGTPLAYTDYHVVAEGYGGAGILVKGGDAGTATAIQKAQELARSTPVLINLHIGKTNFREGSISV